MNAKDSLSVIEFQSLLNGPVKDLLALSAKIGGDVKEQGDLVEQCFVSQKRLLDLAAKHCKPAEPQLEEVVRIHTQPISSVIQFKDKRRSSPYFNHISAVAESILALAWVKVAPTPAPHVKNMQEAAQFFTNRVIKDYKDKNPEHVAWTKALMSVWDYLHKYIKQCHTTGLTWNPRGSPLSTSDGPPPPPPPPPVNFTSPTTESISAGDQSSRGALFAELNRGEAVTSGLRKVTNDMKTHKNPELRAVPGLQPRSGPPTKPPKPGVTNVPAAKSGPVTSVKELRGNKWVVENFKNEHIHITETEQKQTVCIYKCVGCTIEVKGKINSIMIDNCTKTGIVFDSLISALDVVNCQSVQVQTLGQLSTVNVDKTDGCQIFLSADSKFAEVITAKSSEINMLVPKADGEFEEFPIPEQFKTKFDGKGIKTTHSDSI